MLEWVEKNLNVIIWLLIIIAVILIVMKCMSMGAMSEFTGGMFDDITGGRKHQEIDPSKPYQMYLSREQFDQVKAGTKTADVRLRNDAIDTITSDSKPPREIQFITKIDDKGTTDKEGRVTEITDIYVIKSHKDVVGEEGLKKLGDDFKKAFPGKGASPSMIFKSDGGWYKDEEKAAGKFRFFTFAPKK